MLVLLKGGIYEVCNGYGFMRNDIRTMFHGDRYRCSSNIKVLPQIFERL
jgi:hypothetical protein